MYKRQEKLRAGLATLQEQQQSDRQIVTAGVADGLPNRALLDAQQVALDALFDEFDAQVQAIAARINDRWGAGEAPVSSPHLDVYKRQGKIKV